jgi:cytochrome c-type biogenesis protein CcmH/NrfG
MKNRQIVFGLVGIAIGFVLGFFTSDLINKGPVPVGGAPVTQEFGLPEDHPSIEDMQRLRELQERAAADPKDKDVRIALGNTHYDMKRFDAAVKWYEEAVRLDPNNPNVNTDLGTSYLHTNHPDKAIEMYKKSLALDEKHPQTLQNLGFAYFSIMNFADAIASWEKLLAFHPEYPHRTEIEKQIEAAKAHLKAGVKAEPQPAREGGR